MTTTYTYDIHYFSDLHKDAYGFRPSQGFYEWMQTATPDELQAEWNWLCQSAELEDRRRAEAEANALTNLEAHLAKTMADHRVDKATAIRWLDDAYGTQGDCHYLDFHLGVAYGTVERLLGLTPAPIGFCPAQAA
jgi:hypothetical protein